MRDDMKQRAAETVRRAQMSGELGIAVHEGFASLRARGVEDFLGDVIPGASVLAGRAAGRVVLVTDQQVHVFEGTRFDRPKALIASHPRGGGVMRFDGQKITFADGQVVYLSSHQARELAFAAGEDPNVAVAEGVRDRVGITGERGLLAAVGHDPSTFKKRLSDRVGDLLDGDLGDIIGTSEGETSAEGRIVLVTDRSVYVIKSDGLVPQGPALAGYPIGPSAFSQTDAMLTFADGSVVTLGSIDAAREVARAAGVAVAPGHRDGGSWVAEAGLAGIFRLVRDGEPTTATWLVDRGLGLAEQTSALEAIAWAPPEFVAPVLKATRENALQKAFAPDLPAGRVMQPLPSACIAIFVAPGRADDHPVRRYLWPCVDASGSLALESGEQVAREWPADVTLKRHRSDDHAGIGSTEIDTSGLLQMRCVLTGTRLVATALRPTDRIADDERTHWASHFRHEWIHEIGTLTTTWYKRVGLRARLEETRTTYAFYARIRRANGAITEVVVSGDVAETLPPLVASVAEAIVAASPGRRAIEAPPTDKQEGLGRWVRTPIAIDGAVPYSLPVRFD